MTNPRRLYLAVLAATAIVALIGIAVLPPLFLYAFAVIGVLSGSGAVSETAVRWAYRRYARSHCALCPDGIPSPTWHPGGQLTHAQSRILRP